MCKIQPPILVAGCHATISFDVVESDIPLLLGKKTTKNWHLVINASDDTAECTINGETKHVELFISKSGHWCIEIQPNFPLEAISVMFSVSHLSLYMGNFAILHIQFLKRVLMNFGEVA